MKHWPLKINLNTLVSFILFTTILLLRSEILYSQNLVPNPSFESYSKCPDDFSQLHRTLYWIYPANHDGTPDYFNSCDNTGYVSVPNNIFGNSGSYNGNGYAGFYTHFRRKGESGNYREYVQTFLNTEMVANKIYCVSFRVKRAHHDAELPIVSTNNIGMYISVGSPKIPYGINNFWPLIYYDYKPQIEEKKIINDSSSWTLVSGTYLAKGGENCITIGNFQWDINTLITGNKDNSASYYYIDSVNIRLCETTYHAEFEMPDTICVNECFNIENNTTTSFAGNTSGDVLYWNWKFEGGTPTFSDVKNPGEICYKNRGVFSISLVIYDGIKSDSISKKIVVVSDCILSAFYVPNSFTPNMDGINDSFMPEGTGITEFAFAVFNRWGQRVFETNNLSFGWDGTFNGVPCEQGVYVWKMLVIDNFGQQNATMGHVNLLR